MAKRLFDKALPNDENKLRSQLSDLKLRGQILLVVDQTATIGALSVTIARSEGVLVAKAARTLPHALRTLKLADELISELSMLCSFDDDPAAQTTLASNRIRSLLTQIYPALQARSSFDITLFCRHHSGTDRANRPRPRYQCCCRCSATPGSPAHRTA